MRAVALEDVLKKSSENGAAAFHVHLEAPLSAAPASRRLHQFLVIGVNYVGVLLCHHASPPFSVLMRVSAAGTSA